MDILTDGLRQVQRELPGSTKEASLNSDCGSGRRRSLSDPGSWVELQRWRQHPTWRKRQERRRRGGKVGRHIEQSTGACRFGLRIDGQVGRWLGWVAEGVECQVKKFGVFKSLTVS